MQKLSFKHAFSFYTTPPANRALGSLTPSVVGEVLSQCLQQQGLHNLLTQGSVCQGGYMRLANSGYVSKPQSEALVAFLAVLKRTVAPSVLKRLQEIDSQAKPTMVAVIFMSESERVTHFPTISERISPFLSDQFNVILLQQGQGGYSPADNTTLLPAIQHVFPSITKTTPIALYCADGMARSMNRVVDLAQQLEAL